MNIVKDCLIIVISRVIIICILLFFGSSSLYSQYASRSSGSHIYYIASNGNDKWSGRLSSPNANNTDGPWRNLSMIWYANARSYPRGTFFKPGDRILLRRGDVWNAKDNIALPERSWDGGYLNLPRGLRGGANLPIVIGAYGTGNRPVIDGRNIRGRDHQLIRGDECHYVTIQDLHLIAGPRSYFIEIRAFSRSGVSNLKFLRLYIDNSKDIYPGMRGGNGIIFKDAGFRTLFPDSNIDHATPCHHIEVAWCRFIGIGGMPQNRNYSKRDGVTVQTPRGGHFWIHHNEFFYCNEAIDICGESNHIIEYNLIVGTSRYHGLKLHSQFSQVTNSIIRGNVIVGAAGWGIAVENIKNCRIYNNTIYSIPIGDRGWGSISFKEKKGYYGSFKSNEIFNNIFWGRVGIYGSRLIKKIHTLNTFSNNIYFNPNPGWKGVVIDYENGDAGIATVNVSNFKKEWLSKPGITNDMSVDPQFVNPFYKSYNDWGSFHLKPTSPAIDRGKKIGLILQDIQGNPVPQGKAPDIGACEFLKKGNSK